MSNVTPLKEDDRETKVFHFEVKEVKQITRNGVEVGIVEGLGSTFDLDRGDDIILPGAFTETLARHRETNRPVRMLFQHWTDNLIGGFPIDQVRETEKGLEIVGEINLLPGHKGEWAYSLAKQGVLTDFSIGFRVKDEEFKDGIRIIKRLELFEISLVAEPMNPNAVVTAVKSDKNTLTRQVKDYCDKMGLESLLNKGDTVITLEDVDELKNIRDFEAVLKKSGAISNKAIDRLAHFAKSYQGEPEEDSNVGEPQSEVKFGADFYKDASKSLNPE